MKRFSLFSLVFFLVGVLSAQESSAQDYTRLGLPNGALARLGKGSIGGGDRAVAWSPDGTRLAVASSIGIWLYDTDTGAEVVLLTGHTSSVNSVAFSPDGQTLASGGDDDTIVGRGHRAGKGLPSQDIGLRSCRWRFRRMDRPWQVAVGKIRYDCGTWTQGRKRPPSQDIRLGSIR